MNNKIEETHKNNFRLIKKYNLKVGDKLELHKELISRKYYVNVKSDYVTISHIHSLFGWILLKETEQLPQEAEQLLKFIECKEEKCLNK